MKRRLTTVVKRNKVIKYRLQGSSNQIYLMNYFSCFSNISPLGPCEKEWCKMYVNNECKKIIKHKTTRKHEDIPNKKWKKLWVEIKYYMKTKQTYYIQTFWYTLFNNFQYKKVGVCECRKNGHNIHINTVLLYSIYDYLHIYRNEHVHTIENRYKTHTRNIKCYQIWINRIAIINFQLKIQILPILNFKAKPFPTSLYALRFSRLFVFLLPSILGNNNIFEFQKSFAVSILS